MAPSSAEIERQIAELRAAMESRVVELRERGRHSLGMARRAAVVGLGIGAIAALAAVGVLVTYRLTRPPTTEERLRRLLPRGLTSPGRAWMASGRRRPGRLSRGRPSAGDDRGATGVRERLAERLAVQVARAAASAAAGAFAARLLRGLAERGQR
jgi:hypothetical protein